MKCMYCGCTESKVIDSRFDGRGKDDPQAQGVHSVRKAVHDL